MSARVYVSGCVGCGMPGVPYGTYCSDSCWWASHACEGQYENGRCNCPSIGCEADA